MLASAVFHNDSSPLDLVRIACQFFVRLCICQGFSILSCQKLYRFLFTAISLSRQQHHIGKHEKDQVHGGRYAREMATSTAELTIDYSARLVSVTLS